MYLRLITEGASTKTDDKKMMNTKLSIAADETLETQGNARGWSDRHDRLATMEAANGNAPVAPVSKNSFGAFRPS